GRARARDGAPKDAHHDGHQPQAAGPVSHQHPDKAHDALGHAGLLHDDAGQDEEGNGQEREFGDARPKVVGDDGKPEIIHPDGEKGRGAQGYGDGHPQQQQEEERPQQQPRRARHYPVHSWTALLSAGAAAAGPGRSVRHRACRIRTTTRRAPTGMPRVKYHDGTPRDWVTIPSQISSATWIQPSRRMTKKTTRETPWVKAMTHRRHGPGRRSTKKTTLRWASSRKAAAVP